MPRNVSLYITDKNLPLFDAAENLGNGSMIAGLTTILEKHFEQEQDIEQYRVEVEWIWSDQHKQNQMMAGKVAVEKGQAVLWGAVPARFFEIARGVDLYNTQVIIEDRRAVVWFYNAYSSTDMDFNAETAPDSWEKILSILAEKRAIHDAQKAELATERASRAEEAKEKRQLEKNAYLETEKHLRQYVNDHGSKHLKMLMAGNYTWLEGAFSAFVEYTLEGIPAVEAGETDLNGTATTPSMEAIEKLSEIRAWIDARFPLPMSAHCEIVKTRKEESYVEDGYSEKRDVDAEEVKVFIEALIHHDGRKSSRAYYYAV